MKGALATSILLLVHFAYPVCADQWGPWEAANNLPPKQAAASPLQLAVKLFQKHISPADGPRCPMYPTCSSYSLQALRKHGPVIGVFQTVDRLYREGDAEHEHGQPINKWGYIRFSDPLKDNDFWLRPEPKQKPSYKP